LSVRRNGGKTTILSRRRMKKLVVFDLDGTLALSKSSLDSEMAALLARLLGAVKVAVISGGAWTQFEKQVLALLPNDDRLKRLSMLPTCGTMFYRFDGGWKKLYSEDFSSEDSKKIVGALNEAIDRSGYRAAKPWGDLIEDRGSQITFSALGQQAPLAEKTKWDPDFAKRQKIEAILAPMLPGFSKRLGGATSIDVTRPGIDKAYGIRKLQETLDVAIAEMIFVGDAIFPGGNDYPAKQAGVESIRVRDPHETKRVIEAICACLGGC
jgi:phosphomannomutase